MEAVRIRKNTVSLNIFATDGSSLDQNLIRHKAIAFLNNQSFPEGTMLTIVVTHDPRMDLVNGEGGRAHCASLSEKTSEKP